MNKLQLREAGIGGGEEREGMLFCKGVADGVAEIEAVLVCCAFKLVEMGMGRFNSTVAKWIYSL